MQVSRMKREIMGGGGPATSRLSPRSDTGFSRACLHVLTGRVDVPKVCTRQFECYHCAFDQLLDDMDTAGKSRPLSAVCTVASI